MNGRIGGADGYRGRWMLVACDGTGEETSIEVVDSFAELVERPLDILVIDVPMGLLDPGTRQCDRLVRQLISARRNSVFTAPIRPMLDTRASVPRCAPQQAA